MLAAQTNIAGATVTISVSGQNVRIGFDGVSGRTYALEAHPAFATNSPWASNGQTVTATSNGPVSFQVPRTGGAQFFSVRGN